MRIPRPGRVVAPRSGDAGAGIAMVAAAGVARTPALPLQTLMQLLLVAGVVAWAAWSFHVDAMHRGGFAVTEERLAPDLSLVACLGDGLLGAGHVRAATFCGAWVTPIVWGPDGRGSSPSI